MFFYEGSQIIIMMQIVIAMVVFLLFSICLIAVLLRILINKVRKVRRQNGDQPKTDPPSGGA